MPGSQTYTENTERIGQQDGLALAIEKECQKEHSSLNTQHAWGGMETGYEPRYSTHGVVPHEMFEERMEAVLPNLTPRHYTGEEVQAILRAGKGDVVETGNELVVRGNQIRRDMLRILQESRASVSSPRNETDEEAEDELDQIIFQATDKAYMTVLGKILPQSILDRLPKYNKDNRWPPVWAARGTEKANKFHFGHLVDVVSAEKAAPNGVLHVQIGPFLSEGPIFSSRITKPASETTKADFDFNEATLTEDEIVYLVTKEGFVLNPTDAVDLDPQTIQQHNNKQEVTLRTDRVALLVLSRSAHLRYYAPPTHKIEPMEKIEIIIPDELSYAFHNDFLAERNAILEQELAEHAQTVRDHNDLVRRQELAALAKFQSPLTTHQPAFNNDDIAARISHLS